MCCAERRARCSSPADCRKETAAWKWGITSPVIVHSQRPTVAWSADSFSAPREDTTFVTSPSYLTLSLHLLSHASKGSAPTHTAGESDPQHSNLFSGWPLYCDTGSIPTVQFALTGIVSTTSTCLDVDKKKTTPRGGPRGKFLLGKWTSHDKWESNSK